ncbi:MAG TPA: plastocyanin/azurin family copper-binding protein [Gemmatimonadota bacterium]|nr:plastocyanin/azurin family copper-binding protein [Gemmatimonadota bacterium]
MATRREFLRAGGLTLAGFALPPVLGARLLAGRPGTRVAEVRMRSDATGGRVWFDPIGLRVNPGTTVRWVLDANVHSTTAYHPSNGNYALRIPEGVQPWDSSLMTEPGQTFAWRFDVPGVYDYFCIPHELAGMVGRIVVLHDGARMDELREPGPAADGFRPPSPAALVAFPRIAAIVRHGAVRLEA